MIALAGLKVDLHLHRQVSLDEAMAFAKNNGLLHVETSSKTGENVDSLFEQVAREVVGREGDKHGAREKNDNLRGRRNSPHAIIEFLNTHNPDPDDPTHLLRLQLRLNSSALYSAAVARRENLSEVQRLLALDASLVDKDWKGGEKSWDFGFTPLIAAAYRGHLKVVQELVTAGADLMIQESKGKTAKDIADEQKNSDIVNILANAIASKHAIPLLTKLEELENTEPTMVTWNRAKLVFVGQERAGKDSSLASMSSRPFNPKQPSTRGADSMTFTVQRTDHVSGWGGHASDFEREMALLPVLIDKIGSINPGDPFVEPDQAAAGSNRSHLNVEDSRVETSPTPSEETGEVQVTIDLQSRLGAGVAPAGTVDNVWDPRN